MLRKYYNNYKTLFLGIFHVGSKLYYMYILERTRSYTVRVAHRLLSHVNCIVDMFPCVIQKYWVGSYTYSSQGWEKKKGLIQTPLELGTWIKPSK